MHTIACRVYCLCYSQSISPKMDELYKMYTNLYKNLIFTYFSSQDSLWTGCKHNSAAHFLYQETHIYSCQDWLCLVWDSTQTNRSQSGKTQKQFLRCSPTTCRGFSRMIVIVQRSLCFFISNLMGRLNLPNSLRGSNRSGRNRLPQPHTHAHTRRPRNLWSGAAGEHGGDWFPLSLCCHQLSASCPGRARGGPVASRCVVGVSLTCPPHTHTNTQTYTKKHNASKCLPAAAAAPDWKLKLFHAFLYPLGGISRPKCGPNTERYAETEM